MTQNNTFSRDSSSRDLGNVEYIFIAITLRSTLIQHDNAC